MEAVALERICVTGDVTAIPQRCESTVFSKGFVDAAPVCLFGKGWNK